MNSANVAYAPIEASRRPVVMGQGYRAADRTAQTNAALPVIARPTMRVFISRVPS